MVMTAGGHFRGVAGYMVENRHPMSDEIDAASRRGRRGRFKKKRVE